MQQLQAQQAQLLQVAQSTRSLLEQPDSAVPPEEKRRLRASLDQLQAQHQSKLQSCQVQCTAGSLLSLSLSLCGLCCWLFIQIRVSRLEGRMLMGWWVAQWINIGKHQLNQGIDLRNITKSYFK
jgi:hypothetical protein